MTTALSLALIALAIAAALVLADSALRFADAFRSLNP